MECKELIHPFQNDPGTSQHQRVIDDLLAGSAKIDGRNMADLLTYFVQISHHVNFQDLDGSIKDWQPFFANSLPFTLAALTKFDIKACNDKLTKCNKLFDKKPTKAGLQLLSTYIFGNIIQPINKWQGQFQNSDLQVELLLNKLIKDKLQVPIANFILYNNTAVKYFNTQPIDFNKLFDNNIWGLDPTKIYANLKDADFPLGSTKRKKCIFLRDKIAELATNFLDVIRVIAELVQVGSDMEKSFFPLKAELKEKHPPHLAILFSFLKLFAYLQGDLNSYTKKHLDFFYKKVLKLQARDASPDKAHLVFDIQNQLDKYLLKKGLLLKDGKDANKAEIIFATDDEIVVNKAQIADKRTLFINNQTQIEGVYMAPDAGKADGVDKEFKDDSPASWATLGAKYSKYIDPENKFIKPYPNARLGFILASPVLLLNEGIRTVTITLDCELQADYCQKLFPSIRIPANCCDDPQQNNGKPKSQYANFYDDTQQLYNNISQTLNQSYYYINRELIAVAVKQGISKDLLDKLNAQLIDPKEKICYCPSEEKLYEKTLIDKNSDKKGFEDVFDVSEREILKDIFKPRKALNVLFSGEKEWLSPKGFKSGRVPEMKDVPEITLSAWTNDNKFTITIVAILQPDQKAVTFYNPENLKEDFNTTLPVVKIELDDKIKLHKPISAVKKADCCERKFDKDDQPISLYHFFRNVILKDTTIDVQVCGLKNFIVQNDESLQDVNSPIYPFGTRPKVDANFYIGSREVFCKKWVNARINLNWKDKPTDFRDYYKGYVVDKTKTPHIFGLEKDNFQIKIAALEDGTWNENPALPLPKLFDNSPPLLIPALPTTNNQCTHGLDSSNIEREYMQGILLFAATDFGVDFLHNQKFFTENIDFKNFNVNSREGFLKITLKGQDFLHDKYSYVLARQMMALGKLPKDHIEDAIYYDKDDPKRLIVFSTDEIKTELINVGKIVDQVTGDKDKVTIDMNNLEGDATHLTNDSSDLNGDAATLRSDINNLKNNDINTTLKNDVVNLRSDANTGTGLVSQLNNHLIDLDRDVTNLNTKAGSLLGDVTKLDNDLTKLGSHTNTGLASHTKELMEHVASLTNPNGSLTTHVTELGTSISDINKVVNDISNFQAVIPNEPWTPIIKEISLDYTASATIQDIDLIHLYPFQNSYKNEAIILHPALFPTFCDEGNLFIGLKDLVPGSNVNILFQLAEATADSEAEREDLKWYYLENNTWKLLRKGFEVLDDATDGLTTSGIIKFALPTNMTNQNSILPKGLHWIKAGIPQKSKSVSEIFGIYTQAIRATFVNAVENDLLRLANPLPANAISKLKEADAAVKKVLQPYDSFGGMIPEEQEHFYVRVSELLKHKGRAIQKFDYERLALEAFPELFKIKCINHSFALNAHQFSNDYPLAPGYVILAVIPDLNQLKAAQQFEPRVPISILEKIEVYLKQRTSPFVRLRAMNPRYEKINFCLRVKLYLGKDENYYKEKLKEDLREFLAPWAVGEYSKLTFGQCVYRSDIVRFLETRDYVDYITDLQLWHEEDETKPHDQQAVCPITPRSILLAGDIDLCIASNDCEQWKEQNPCANMAIQIVGQVSTLTTENMI